MTTATIKGRKAAGIWQKKYNSQAPKVGDIAPDFELTDSKGEDRIRLSDYRDKQPVALIFGSYT